MTRPTSFSRAPRLILDIETTDLVQRASELLADDFRLASVVGHDDTTSLRVVYVFLKGPPDQRVELSVRLDPARAQVPTLAAVSFSASRFERELRDLFGIEPVNHPQARRLVLHQHWPQAWHPMLRNAGEAPKMVGNGDGYPFIPVDGPGVYEVPVGPVHAGLIEPGHFRFFVVGETILRMKARLWFTHKGIEKLIEGRSIEEGLEIAQRVSGDTTVGHGLAFIMAVEEALGIEVSEVHRRRRAQVLEMERLYNHVADMGALCNDVAFSVANSMALTIRERLLRLNEDLTGHRLLRGAVRLGACGLRRSLSLDEIDSLGVQINELLEVVRTNALVLDRFSGTAFLSGVDARDLGTVGPVARSSGLGLDARNAHPFVEMPSAFDVVTDERGDVLARFEVRAREIGVALECLRAWSLDAFEPVADAVHDQREDRRESTSVRLRSGLGVVEGWRGVIVHRVELDNTGLISRLKIVDPSFLNWPALPVCLADTILPDFPVANKSFNLSYAGNDL